MLILDTICKKNFRGQAPGPHLPKIEPSSLPLGLRPCDSARRTFIGNWKSLRSNACDRAGARNYTGSNWRPAILGSMDSGYRIELSISASTVPNDRAANPDPEPCPVSHGTTPVTNEPVSDPHIANITTAAATSPRVVMLLTATVSVRRRRAATPFELESCLTAAPRECSPHVL